MTQSNPAVTNAHVPAQAPVAPAAPPPALAIPLTGDAAVDAHNQVLQTMARDVAQMKDAFAHAQKVEMLALKAAVVLTTAAAVTGAGVLVYGAVQRKRAVSAAVAATPSSLPNGMKAPVVSTLKAV